MNIDAKLTSKSFVALYNYLEEHELDIANSMHDFGRLKPVFIQMFSRSPRMEIEGEHKHPLPPEESK
ncbi:MAG: hypothetical protein RTU92_08525 [Candidatus Thorarchaeota archaeon]